MCVGWPVLEMKGQCPVSRSNAVHCRRPSIDVKQTKIGLDVLKEDGFYIWVQKL